MKSIHALHNMVPDDQPEAAVSIIRCIRPVDSVLLLRRKKIHDDPWSGHFAFPGGRRDPGDTTIFHTCLRETLEETGITLDHERLAQQLPVTPAGRNVMAPIQVQPYLFVLSERPEVVVEPAEIDNYVWINVQDFTNTERHKIVEVRPSLVRPVFPLQDYYLWGFTYGLLCSILDIRTGR